MGGPDRDSERGGGRGEEENDGRKRVRQGKVTDVVTVVVFAPDAICACDHFLPLGNYNCS